MALTARYENITGATSSTYTLVFADVDKLIMLEAPYADGHNTTETMESINKTDVVLNVNVPPVIRDNKQEKFWTQRRCVVSKTLSASDADGDAPGRGSSLVQMTRVSLRWMGRMVPTLPLVENGPIHK